MDFTATGTAILAGIPVRSVNSMFLKMHQRFAQICEQDSTLSGGIAVNKPCFGARRMRGKRGYDGLVEIGSDWHFRVNHEASEFASGAGYIIGIESFRSYSRRWLAKFNGIPKRTFTSPLRETAFCFNHHRANLYRELLKLLRLNTLLLAKTH